MRSLCVLFLSLFVLSFELNAQEVQVFGRVVEGSDNVSVPFVNALLVNEQDSIVAAALSDDKGEFQMKCYTDNLTLRLSGIGYKDTVHEVVFTGEKKLDLGDVKIEKDVKLLGDVDVAAQNTVVQKFDRKVYTMNENKKAASKDIYDLLKSLPGVVVDEQKNIRYKGAEASILVDDMPAEYLYPDLEMIPVQMVDKIELIDASMQTGEIGKGGIINIRMKIQKEDGLSGVISSRGSFEKDKLNSGNMYVNLNLKAKKWVFFNNAYAMKGRWANESELIGVFHYDDTDYLTQSNSGYDYEYNYLMDYFGAQYNISDKTKFVLSLGLSKNSSENHSSSDYTRCVGDSLYRVYTRIQNSMSDQWNGNVYAFFRHSFDTTLRELKIYANINLPQFDYLSESRSDYHYSHLNFSDVDSAYSTDYKQDYSSSSIYAGAYYNHPLSEKSRWNANYRISMTNTYYDDDDFYVNDVLSIPQSSKENGINIRQFLSLRFGTTLGKWKLDAGINQQHWHYNFNLQSYNDDLSDTIAHIRKDFYDILPSATCMFTIDSLQDVKLSFSRTARAPWYSQLNPILFKRNPFSWSQGNPNLESVIHNNVYLGYSLNKPMWNFSAELFYSQTNNDVAYLEIPVSESVHLSMPDNYAYNSRLGVDLSGYYSIKGKYNFSLSGSLYHSELDSGDLSDALASSGIQPENVTKKNFGYNVKLSTDVSIAKNTSAMFYVNYTSQEYNVEGYEFDRLSSSISLTQRFFSRKLTVSLGANNILNSLLPRGSYTNYLGYEYTDNVIYSTEMQPMIYLSVNYRFNQGDRNTGQVGQNVN